MNKKDKTKFDQHYKQLLKCLKLQGKAENTIDSTPVHYAEWRVISIACLSN